MGSSCTLSFLNLTHIGTAVPKIPSQLGNWRPNISGGCQIGEDSVCSFELLKKCAIRILYESYFITEQKLS